jgi:threonine dehydrogenase-like Zn-dependent dehydrogenase
MREAVTVAPRSIELRDATPPGSPGRGEALLDIAAVGLCGSDLELYRGTDPYAHFPLRQGHEYSAWIAAFGPGDHGTLAIGDLVAVEPLLPCGQCVACRRGHPNCCVNLRVTGGQIDGAFVNQLIMPVSNLYAANDLTPEEAAFVEPVSIGLQMVTRSGVQSGEQAVVFGAGPIGQSVILAATDHGARVLAVDRIAGRLALARELGAEETVDTTREDLEARVGSWTGGDGPVAVYEATGSTAVFVTALEIVAYSGTIVVAGTPIEEVCFPPFWLVKKELNLLGSRNNAGVFGEAVEIVRRNRAGVRRLLTHTFVMERLQEAIEFAIANPAIAEKVVIRVGDGPAAAALEEHTK